MTTRPRLAIFDLVGTTIHDRGVVPAALRHALGEVGVDVTDDQVRRIRGASKREAIASLIANGHDRDARIEAAYAAFNARLAAAGAAGHVAPIAGARAVLESLRGAGMRVALTTGLERDVAEPLVRAASLDGAADALVCGDDVSRGRPAPYLIFRAMEATGETSVHDVACIGDTPLDLQAGFHAGVRWNVGVLSGGQTRAQLETEPHTHILDSVASLPSIGWLAGAPADRAGASYAAFQPREITPLPASVAGGFRIKRYAVAPAGIVFDQSRFAAAERDLAAQLPAVDAPRGRPGAAILILHQGATADYAVMSWWDRENEMPTRVWTRPSGVWAPAADDESFCVWDLELLWFERNAWIETVLAGGPLEEGLEAYHARTFGPRDRRA